MEEAQEQAGSADLVQLLQQQMEHQQKMLVTMQKQRKEDRDKEIFHFLSSFSCRRLFLSAVQRRASLLLFLSSESTHSSYAVTSE